MDRLYAPSFTAQATSLVADLSIDSQRHQSLETFKEEDTAMAVAGSSFASSGQRVRIEEDIPMVNFGNNFAQNQLQPDIAMADIGDMDEPQDAPSIIEEADISPLEYARANGLSKDYLSDGSWLVELTSMQKKIDDKSLDESHLTKVDFGTPMRLEERITVPKESAGLIAWVFKPDTPEDIAKLVAPMMVEDRTVKKLRVELPLLRTNHKADCKKFARREGFEVRIQEVVLPLERVIEEKDQGLSVPTSFWHLGNGLIETLKKDKIAVSKDAIQFLQTTLKTEWTEKDKFTLWEELQTYKRNNAREPVTPPLSPRPTPYEPFEPPALDPVMQVPILSDPVSPTKHELAEIEKNIFEQDLPTPLRKTQSSTKKAETLSFTYTGDEPFRLSDVYSPLKSLDTMHTPPSVELPRQKREHLKVEETLTPPGPDLELPKTVRFSDIIEEMELNTGSPMNSPGFESKFFEDAFGPAYEKATRMSEQERLLEADATARVEVPIMDFTKAFPPWKGFEGTSNETQKLALRHAIMREVIGTNNKKWLGVKSVEIKLKWNPFPNNLAKVALEEPLRDDDHTWKTIVQPESEKIIDSSSLAWKPEGLRILQDDDDDDEIEFGQFKSDSPQSMSALLKKRKTAMAEVDPNIGASSKLLSKFQVPQPIKANPSEPSAAPRQLHDDSSIDDFGLLGGAFSASNSLDNYLELRGAKKPKLSESGFFKKAGAQTNPEAVNKRVNSPQVQLSIRLSPAPKPKTKPDSLPVPAFTIPQPPTSIVVSSTLLRHRALIKCLETTLPNLNIVERDFSAHNTLTWLPGSVTRSPVTSPLAAEADLIISSSTGILLTTVQKIKQQPLPGSKTKSAIRERLENVAVRYEKLVVFVSEGRKDEYTDGLDESSCLSFAEFTAFALGKSHQTDISVQFVGGGEETLAKWIAGAIIQLRVASQYELLAEETHWEVFLRRAGLNAMAAQTVVGMLKAPEGVNTQSPSKSGLFGLPAFVEMGREERVRRFGVVCGRRVVERVSDLVDASWL